MPRRRVCCSRRMSMANGTQELLVGGEDNFLRCLDDAGKVMWEFAAPAPVCSVWVGDLIGDDAAEVVGGDR